MKKKKRLSFFNLKRAGRPAKVDIGIRHIRRARFSQLSVFHLTIKVRENKADIQNKRVLKALHHAIKRARLQKLKVIHYTLEYNHAHLVVEAQSNRVLHRGMQAFGISIAKAINKIKHVKGTVYKHRYHLKKLSSRRELKNAIQYVFRNGMKHKRAMSKLDPYNSLPAEKRIPADINLAIEKSLGLSKLREDLRKILEETRVFYLNSKYLWD